MIGSCLNQRSWGPGDRSLREEEGGAVLAALLEVHVAPLVVELEVGVGEADSVVEEEADSVAEGGVEVSAVEVATVVVDSLPVEAEEGLLLGDAAEVNLTFIFYQ